MYKMTQIVLASLSLIFFSCDKKYKYTVKVCGGRLYAESFNIKPAGVDEDYLTDSINFRIYIGKYDNGHENFGYECNGDSITVMKLVVPLIGPRMKVVESRTLSLSELVKNNTKNNKPLFEFK